MHDPEILLGLVSRSAVWPQRLEAWSAAANVPIAITYCQSLAHLHASLRAAEGGRVVLLDGDLSFVDRDLLGDIATAGGVTIVVDGIRRRRRWRELGAAAELPADFDQAQLLTLLGSSGDDDDAPTGPAAAPLVAVTGPGGTGASVSAIALAQGLAVGRGRVVLADCCLHAEQGMLHSAHGSHPGLVEIIDLHADRTPQPRQVRQLALGIVERGYYLVPGIPRARHWSRIGAESLRAAVGTLRTAFDVVVADVDPDVEGEAQGGSLEVEERNVLARTVVLDADAVIVVGQPTLKGVHALVRTVVEMLELGVRPERVLPVLNEAPDDAATRAEVHRAVTHLLDGVAGGGAVRPALFAPVVLLEACLRERDAVPDEWASMLSTAVTAVLDRAPPPQPHQLEPVAAGTLGHWGGDRVVST